MRNLWVTIRHYWHIHLTVALCTAVATGVLAGALIVGDSMRGSLQNITLERLGAIQHAIIADHFFESDVVTLSIESDLVDSRDMVSAILLNGSVTAAGSDHRASKVNIYGVEKHFFRLWEKNSVPIFSDSTENPIPDIVINETLQNELNVKIGDSIIVSFPQAFEIHPEFLLGQRDETASIKRLRVVISDIIPTEDAGRFSLHAHQSLPMNAYISLPVLQKALSIAKNNIVNALFSVDTAPITPDMVSFTLEELGLTINEHRDYFDLQSDQFLIKSTLSKDAISVATENNIPVLSTLTYLANSITASAPSEDPTADKVSVPYSTILALPVEIGEFAEFLNLHLTDSDRIDYSQARILELRKQASDKRKTLDEIKSKLNSVDEEITKLKRTPERSKHSQEFKKKLTETEETVLDIENRLSSVANPIEVFEIYLNEWTANDLGVEIGDKVDVTYFNVNVNEEYNSVVRQFILRGIVPIEKIAADINLIPDFPGVSDSNDISEWDPPFPFDNSLIRANDEAYWDEYKSAPKAFISLETGKKLWENRFGDLTTIRMTSSPNLDINETRRLFESELLKNIDPEQLGFQFLNLRSEGLQSAKGSSDFGMLFSSMSGFIIIAVALLVGMVFRIGVEQRSREIGILQAVGYPLARIRRSFLLEGTVISFFGCLLGCLLAVGYANLMIYGLKTWWLPAIGTPFLKVHVGFWSLICGTFVSFIVIMFTIYKTIGKMGKISTVSLLEGESDFANSSSSKHKEKNTRISGRRLLIMVAVVIGLFLGIMDTGRTFTGDWSSIINILIIGSILLLTFRVSLRWFLKKKPNQNSELINQNVRSLTIYYCSSILIGVMLTIIPFVSAFAEIVVNVLENPAVRFLTVTSIVMGLSLLFFEYWLNSHRESKRLSRMQFTLKNSARQPTRSRTCVATISLACCIIVAVGANRQESTPESEFAFIAESSLPLHHSLNTADGRFELGFDEEESEVLSKSVIYPFRVLPGEDVSCLNLYRPEKPQIIGASSSLLSDDTWKHLREFKSVNGRIPAIGDENSLRWILHHNPDEDLVIEDEFGESLGLKLKTIKNSLFQSQLIISESDFTKHFPSQNGYQFFLIKTPTEMQAKTSQILEKTLQDYGFDVTLTSQRLANFRSVQNTYISTFQSLGGLGIILGTLGLALVLLRNIMERKGELATLRAFGFRRGLLSRMLFLESSFLLIIGMSIGIVTGLFGVFNSLGELPTFPWISLTITLLFILSFGIIANAIAVFFALRMPLLSTLKSE